MLVSKARRLRFEKEEREGRKLTQEVIRSETGLARTTLLRMLQPEPLERIDANTIDALCEYFEVGLCDLLEFTPGDKVKSSEGADKE